MERRIYLIKAFWASLLCLFISLSGCMTSPEVKWADDALAEQRYDEARAMYKRALGYGIHDDSERQKIREKLASIDQQLAARKQAEFDGQARQEQSKSVPPDQRLLLLIDQFQDTSLSQSVRDEAGVLLEKEANLAVQKDITPDSLAVLEKAHALVAEQDKNAASRLRGNIGLGLLNALKRSQTNKKDGAEWLKVTTAITTWQSYPNASAIKVERGKLAQVIIKIASNANDKKACNTWFK